MVANEHGIGANAGFCFLDMLLGILEMEKGFSPTHQASLAQLPVMVLSGRDLGQAALTVINGP